jgi:hypothetical protein
MRRSLARDIALVLVLKLAALTALYLVFFSPAHRPVVSERALAHGLFGADTRERGGDAR